MGHRSATGPIPTLRPASFVTRNGTGAIRPILGLGIILLLCTPCSAASEAEAPRLITVNGEAEIDVVPDEVVLTVGVETFDADMKAAKADNDRRVTALIGAAHSLGVAKEHVRTDYLNIEPRYHDQYEKQTFLGYVVRKTVVVTLRDVSKFEALLSSLLAAGANYVHGIEFRTTTLRKHRDKARELALQAAREKGLAMARTLGQSIGRPRSIQEGYSGWGSWYGSWWRGFGGTGMSQNVVQSGGGAGPRLEGPTAPGQIAVTASVTVTFELIDEPARRP